VGPHVIVVLFSVLIHLASVNRLITNNKILGYLFICNNGRPVNFLENKIDLMAGCFFLFMAGCF